MIKIITPAVESYGTVWHNGVEYLPGEHIVPDQVAEAMINQGIALPTEETDPRNPERKLIPADLMGMNAMQLRKIARLRGVEFRPKMKVQEMKDLLLGNHTGGDGVGDIGGA